METKTNYLLLGVFFSIVLAAFAGFIVWLGKLDRNMGEYSEYFVSLKELPRGVRNESVIHYLGLPVGFVKSYSLKDNSIEMKIWIQKEIPVMRDSSIIITPALTGAPNVKLNIGSGEKFAKNEKKILRYQESWIDKGIDNTEQILERINLLLSDQNIENISKLIENVSALSMSLNTFSTSLNTELKDLSNAFLPLAKDLRRNSTSLERVLDNADRLILRLGNKPSDLIFGKNAEKLGPRE